MSYVTFVVETVIIMIAVGSVVFIASLIGDKGE